MNGDVGASDDPKQDLTRPPLPYSSYNSNHRLEQKEHESSNVDYEHSLQQFAIAISDDLNELHTRFLHENDVTFATWKRLWNDMRMSGAFLVEFWGSTPTNIHKTILQQALDGLIWCIEDQGGQFENTADVTALIGRVFAMYCAYSVQAGSPKHKIDVDPHAWTVLLTINCVISGVGATLFPIAAREVRAMMHHLVVQENAFLRCLKGFGPSVRVKNRTPRSVNVVSHNLSLVADNMLEENMPIHQSKIEQLKTLNDRYQELMSRACAEPSVFGAGARLGLRRSKPVVSSFLHSTSRRQESEGDGHELTRVLTLYMEYKANEEIRRYERAARAAAVRKKESQRIYELSANSSNVLELSDRDSTMSGPSTVVARSVASNRRGFHKKRDDGVSEALLVELESGLCADISSDHFNRRRTQSSHILAISSNERSYLTLSEASDADSDALADLEHELEQRVDIVSSKKQEHAIVEKPLTRRRRKCSRNAAVSRKGPCVLALTVDTMEPVCTKYTRSAAKRARNSSMSSRLSFADSWAMSSFADNDELAAIQAELDATPTLSRPLMGECVSRCIKRQQPEVKRSARRPLAATLKSKQAALRISGCASGRSRLPIQHDECKLPADARSSKALSVVSDSSELIAQLQAELDISVRPTTNGCTSSGVVQIKPRRSSRLSSVTSATDNSTIEELERELNATDAVLGTVPPPFVPAITKTRCKQAVVTSKRAALRTRTTRINAKRTRLNDATVSNVPAARRSAAVQTYKAKGERQCFVSGPTIVRPESLRTSTVQSDTESDGIAELVAELNTPVAIQISTPAHVTRNLLAKRSSTRFAGRHQSPSAPNTGASHVDTARLTPTSSVVIPDTMGLRQSARLSLRQASDTESDGLGDLMTQLKCDPLEVNTKKVRKRRRRVETTSQMQSSRVQVVKSRRNQAKEGVRVARAARQSVSQEIAAKPPIRELPAVSARTLSSRRSTRSSSIAFGSESDGLAELEAELQAGHT